MDKTREVYISVDVETDGPCAGTSSMLSLGAAAIGWNTESHTWDMSHSFSANLIPLPECQADPMTTHEFWEKNPEAWDAVNVDQRPAGVVMQDFEAWLGKVRDAWKHRQMTMVCAPTAFDYPFLKFYMCNFLGVDKYLGHGCIDAKSVASTILKLPYRDTAKSYPKAWSRDQFRHSHIAVEDAIEQAFWFCRMIEDL